MSSARLQRKNLLLVTEILHCDLGEAQVVVARLAGNPKAGV